MRPNNFVRLGARVRALFGAHARRSAAFEEFSYSLCADRASPRGGLDLVALAALQGRERLLAERMLLNAAPEARAIVGLGALATPRAARRLAELFEQERVRAQAALIDDDANWSGALMIATAAALWRIEPREGYARAVIGRLRCARSSGERMDAAVALASMPASEVAEALHEALEDRDALVRHHAARALLKIHGVEVDPRATHCMIYSVMASEAGRREDGRRDIAAALVDRPLMRSAG